ncbi:MAG: chromosomal replication initiator protein DnaA [Clostridia bacterium]|nr:chromosomal replication initiator protein DnaA [Clostridia bacterium]MBQ4586315.1 chromosomal replication initiator protein DnaA [Clostridia bacterium]MBR2932887.1 chromosomal replication initiator protein DnaA [Clostridia bacterium]MBR6687249.1 chromosomal replication initiator protein DnaA [Clostridia bacterium]
MESYEILWKNTLQELEKTISNITLSMLEKLSAIDLVGSTLILKSPTQSFANHATRVSDKINEAFKSAETGITDFKIYVGDSTSVFYASQKEPEEMSSPIDPKYTFDSFVVGANNRYLYAAAKAVADDPCNSYNPLFIYGDTGLGKTHIMHAIANSLKKNHPNLNVLYATCEKFTNDLINTIRQGKAYSAGSETFRNRYRNVDVLIIDDVQFLAKKQSTQEEFFHTFNELYGKNKQIILSADCQPKDIALLEERLLTRFQGGLMAQVLPPDIETKIAIIQKKAEEKKYILSFEIASYLAENSDDDVRSLEGLLNKVIFASLLNEAPITLSLAMEALSVSRPQEDKEEQITPSTIINTVCNFYKIAKADLLGKKKNKELVEPRQICTYLITELLSIPLVSVGQAMGGKDHTTVIYTRDKIADLIKKDPRVATEVNDLKNLILKK